MFCSYQFHTGWPNFNIPLMYMYGYKSCLYKHVYVLYIYCITGIYIYRYSVLIYFYMFIYMVYIYIHCDVTGMMVRKWIYPQMAARFSYFQFVNDHYSAIYTIYTHTIYTANAWACPEPRPRQATHHHHHHHHHQTLIEDLQWMY